MRLPRPRWLPIVLLGCGSRATQPPGAESESEAEAEAEAWVNPCPDGEIPNLDGICVPNLNTDNPEKGYLGYYGEDIGLFEPATADEGVYLDGGEFEVPAGQERTRCTYFILERDVIVGRYEARMAPFSHHFNMLEVDPASLTDVEQGVAMPCITGPVPLGYIAGAQWQYVDAPMYGGLGLRVPAGTAVEMQSHYINTGEAPLTGRVEINLYHRPAEQVEHYLGLYFNVMQGIAVPPGEQRKYRGRQTAHNGVSVVLLTSHMHRFGQRFTIGVYDRDSETTELVYDSPEYDRPLIVQRATSPLIIGPNQMLEWSCEYDNFTQQMVRDGAMGLTAEMCIMAAFYYDDFGALPFALVDAEEVPLE